MTARRTARENHSREREPRSNLQRSARQHIDVVFPAGTAGYGVGGALGLDRRALGYQLLAKLRTPRVRRFRGKQPVPLRSHITQSHQIIARNLVLDRKFIFLGVRQSIFVIESRRAADRAERIIELSQSVIRRP